MKGLKSHSLAFAHINGSDRRKRKRLLLRSPTPSKEQSRAKQRMAGTAGVGGQRRGHPKLLGAKTPGQSGLTSPPVSCRPEGESPSTCGESSLTAPNFPVTGSQEAVDPRNRFGTSMELCLAVQGCRGGGYVRRKSGNVLRSENPRPSSRETAMPPYWASGRGNACRGQPSVRQRHSPAESR